MWEYDRITIKFFTISELTDNLNKIGAEGWEIIKYDEIKPEKFGDVISAILIVKRNTNKTQKQVL